MAWHLAAPGRRIDCSSGGLIEHLSWRHTKLQTESSIAVIRVEPVVCGLQDHPRSRQNGLVARSRYLKEDLVLSLELHFLVVNASRQEHRAVGSDQLFRRKPGAC